ncbi:MAG: large-conductance mechanosensitive channel protein MscL [Treponema sp.]|uniref:large-conductance mechanosensitive channel protein MscL n=1 Tax=Treponema sp. TaxID=166 RepID=UPI00298E2CD7|nr:large-conductance mechanosensitive channel protein MscL [Treponema sp.]MCQ2600585.1 large-conductance mechanosensitive channel protein MscL [Treponema sp.]
MANLKSGLDAAGKELSAFKKFISRGNVVDMAVGVIIGGAFGKIVTSLVNDIVMPLISALLGKVSLVELTVKIGEAEIKYGAFLQTILDFFIIAICIFIVIRLFETFKKKTEKPKEEDPAPIVKSDEAVLLEEIRDLLKNKQ